MFILIPDKTGTSIFNPQKCFIKNYSITVGDAATPAQVETYPTSVQAKFVIVHL